MKMLLLVALLPAMCYCSFAQSDMLLKHSDKGNYLNHKVQPKENFYAIGRLYNISPKDIAAFNNLDMNNGLNKDQVLQIPLIPGNFSQGVNAGVPVYVRAGESDDLKKVSSANKVSVENIRRWNSLSSDKITSGTRLVVGFLISKEMAGQVNFKKDLSATAEKKVKNEPEPLPKKEDPKPAVKNSTTEIATSPIQDKETKPIEKPAIDESNKSTAANAASGDQGYFKSTFDQQIKTYPANKQETLISGIFKTASGWQDTKYYLLMDGVQAGMVVKVMNPDNNKVVYAKVLGEMSGIRQNEGLNIRMSNSAAAVLEVADPEKFTVKLSY